MSLYTKIPPISTSIPFSQRLIAILQLCIAFSLLLWYTTQPFMGEYFNLRARLLLYEYVMGTNEKINNRAEQTGRFDRLSEEERGLLLKDYRTIQAYAKRPVWQKIGNGIKVLLLGIPPFELAWIVFSTVIAILLLRKVEGAKQAVWLLPLITIAYIADNQLKGHIPYQPADQVLFPTEEEIVHDYVKEPLASAPLDQMAQLEAGWNSYLANQWSEEGNQEEGEFNFTVARLKLLQGEPLSKWVYGLNQRIKAITAIFYLLWSVFFAWLSGRSNATHASNSLKTTIPAK